MAPWDHIIARNKKIIFYDIEYFYLKIVKMYTGRKIGPKAASLNLQRYGVWL